MRCILQQLFQKSRFYPTGFGTGIRCENLGIAYFSKYTMIESISEL